MTAKEISDRSADRIYLFGAHSLVPKRRVLLRGSEPVHIGSRAFAILVALVERAGSVVPAHELIRIAWPGVVVDEANLRVQIGSLRRLLNSDKHKQRTIDTVPLQGYCFVMPVEEVSSQAAERPVETLIRHNLPAELATIVGRDETIDLLVAALGSRRLITVTGPGGIGKTTVALAVARCCLPKFQDGARFVDFSTVSDVQLTTSALASKLGISVLSEDAMTGLLTQLTGKRLLLVLDTCEHVVEAVAVLVETLLANLPEIRILTTSREPLRATGEWVHRLQPLPVPPDGPSLRAVDVIAYPAVDLFVQRVSANLDRFELRDPDAPFVSTICRQLDGIPLAIEFAAAHVEEIGLREVAARLNDRFSMLTRGRRTALPRHQTLAATLEWSYDLLAEQERAVLRHLSVFRGAFTAAAARAVAMHELERQQAAATLSNLHAKSLVTADIGADVVLYRMLDTTRFFATEKQVSAGERKSAEHRHAQYVLEAVRCAEKGWETHAAAAWIARYGYLIEDTRGALEFAFSAAGDRELGVQITAASAHLWFALSLLEEYRCNIERSLAAVEAGAPAQAACVIRLWDALGHALWLTWGDMPATANAFSRAWEIADRENRLFDKLRALWGRLVLDNTNGDYRDSIQTLERFGQLAAGFDNPKARLTYQRMAALGLHYAGDHARAREHAEYILNHANEVYWHDCWGLQFDQRITARSMLARILWLQGYPDLAGSHAREALELSRSARDVLSECYVLAVAVIPLAFWSGDVATARSMTGLLLTRSLERGYGIWIEFARGYDIALKRRSDPSIAVPNRSPPGIHLSETLATIDESLADEALFERAARGLAGWCTPELLRIRANRAIAGGESDTEVESLLVQAIEIARHQGAVAWELRAAASLADFLHGRSRGAEAHRVLSPVVERYSEGFATTDLMSAAAKLGQLQLELQPQ